MKEMTGGDKMYARGLFQEPFEFKPQFKLVLACNDPPEMPKDDGGVWRRVKMVHFPSKFRPKDDLTADDGHWNADKTKWTPKDPMNPVYPMDESVDQKFAEWKDVFLYMLLEQYKHYKEKGLIIPAEVKATTNQYRQSQFKLGEFFKETVEIDMDYQGQISLTEIYTTYKDWFQENAGGNKKEMLKKQDLSQYLESYYSEHQVDNSPNLYTHIKINDIGYRGTMGADLTSRISFQDVAEVGGLDDES
jgi:putative DNA primase/helicase